MAVDLLAAGTGQLGLQLSTQQLERFERYMELLVDWSQRVSLTAVKDEEGIQRRHFLESAALVRVLRGHGISLEDSSLIDVGSGAGLPGIPLKIVEPSIRLTLVEAKQRKSAFLKAAVSELDLHDVEIITTRAEDAGHDEQYREAFDFAVAKALAPLRTLVELTLPFVRIGGIVIAPKGKEAETEVNAAQTALETLNGTVRSIDPIPLAQPQQYVVLIDKELPTPDGFPRRPGMPAKRPL